MTDDTAFTYITTFGDFGARGDNGYSHSILFDTQLTDNINYIFQSDLATSELDGVLDHDVGINQYLLYSINDYIGLGSRIEWWHDDGTSFNAYTFGVNVRPTERLVFRPEIRHDWSPANDLAQTTFGVDVFLTF